MMLPAVGFITSAVFLYIGWTTDDAFLLIAALFSFGLSLFAIDYTEDRRYARVSDELNHSGSLRVGYERKDRAA
jgi:hypothetical protein